MQPFSHSQSAVSSRTRPTITEPTTIVVGAKRALGLCTGSRTPARPTITTPSASQKITPEAQMRPNPPSGARTRQTALRLATIVRPLHPCA
jgi:hypothetical protein